MGLYYIDPSGKRIPAEDRIRQLKMEEERRLKVREDERLKTEAERRLKTKKEKDETNRGKRFSSSFRKEEVEDA